MSTGSWKLHVTPIRIISAGRGGACQLVFLTFGDPSAALRKPRVCGDFYGSEPPGASGEAAALGAAPRRWVYH